ncbi:SpoIIE family protein phosphatase [Lipingzhangella sp. LS1_29]|uniref:SpoIIE family protein phosphatase n=1 Tax=Lipingzhangella rawalii TaxID=2055835 RepID=A0ABU2H7L9_9ACTN|nr:SpoIIE family protein phosphatase [Lipingzhangella rawalii]MDS1271304.1 SpoIIE family protein phosphatase [Lipingzhangella rawalii]
MSGAIGGFAEAGDAADATVAASTDPGMANAAEDVRALRALAELRTASGVTALWTIDLSTRTLSELFGPSKLWQTLCGEQLDLPEVLTRVHTDDRDRLREAVDSSAGGADFEQRFRMVDRYGDERWLHARARYLDAGRPRLVGLVDDVTEHTQLVRRLADRRRIEAAQARRVNELAAKLVSATTVDEITGLLTHDFLPIFSGASSAVMLVEDGALVPYPASEADHPPFARIAGRDAADTSFPMGAVIRDSQPRFYDNRAEVVERFPAVRELLPHVRSQAWATVPIFGDGRSAIGVWQVAWNEARSTPPDERALMLTLAGLAGQALQRVRAQAAQLELADAVQQRMLPGKPPQLSGLDLAVRYLPARQGSRVCGDFYDAIQLSENRVGLVVGDVQGHGVEAAAAMGQVRIAFRAYAKNRFDPGEVLAETNRMFAEGVDEDVSFSTCGYLVLELDTGRMRAAWAGQPPLVVASEADYEIWQPATGPPVGVDPDSTYPVSERLLDPGQTLLMCSDGLLESTSVPMDEGLAQVGQALISQQTNVEETASRLVELTPAGRGDDIALLVARMWDRHICGIGDQ